QAARWEIMIANVLEDSGSSLVAGAAIDGRAVAVRWRAGSVSRFPFFWLRHNCRCPACRHPNGQRLVDVLDIPQDIAPRRRGGPRGGAIELQGSDGPAATSPAVWLAAHDPAPAARAARRPQPTLWGGDLSPVPEVDWPGLLADPAVELGALEQFEAYG